MSAEDRSDEYIEAFDAVYAAMHDAALLANTAVRITPPMLYAAIGNLGPAAAFIEILASRPCRAEHFELYDSDGNNPHEPTYTVMWGERGRSMTHARTAKGSSAYGLQRHGTRALAHLSSHMEA